LVVGVGFGLVAIAVVRVLVVVVDYLPPYLRVSASDGMDPVSIDKMDAKLNDGCVFFIFKPPK
jgi:hypothetical protein